VAVVAALKAVALPVQVERAVAVLRAQQAATMPVQPEPLTRAVVAVGHLI
jgi:exosome complex RNA-binding protein Rrp42 (RNase PH superfamily)